MSRHSVLFVCLGNICRSTTAETVFRDLLSKRGCAGEWEVDSAGTAAWNVGMPPDPGSVRAMKKHGMDSQHRARQVNPNDFQNFEYILCMDHSNLQDLRELAPSDCKATVGLLGRYASQPEVAEVIEDPYGGTEKDFEICFEQCQEACIGFLESCQSH